MIKYIKVENCMDGWLYEIHARNAEIGIYFEKFKGFVICRIKWASTYEFMEFHYDTGAPYGTVKPIKPIEKSPFTAPGEDGILKYLKEKEGGLAN